MPIMVKCVCGKAFRVRDELVGQEVTCQVCGRAVAVSVEEAPEGGAVESVATAAFDPGTAAPVESQEPTMTCPACAEIIPEDSAICPICGEQISGILNPKTAGRFLDEKIARLDEEVGHPVGGRTMQATGRVLTGVTIAMAVICVLLLIGLVSGAVLGGADAVPVLIILGLVLLLPFGIGFFVSLSHDKASRHIADARTPAEALRRYMMSLHTVRLERACDVLAPGAREVGKVSNVTFEKIAFVPSAHDLSDAKGFKKYWKSVFKAAGSYQRTCQLGKYKLVGKTPSGIEIVETTLTFSSYSSLLMLLIFINIILCAIVIGICTKREKRTIRKALIQREGRWFVLDAEFEGPVDRAAALLMKSCPAK